MNSCALVIGAAGGVWEEVEAAKKLYSFDCIIVINAAGVNYPDHVDHWVTFHVDLLPHWISLRAQRGYPAVTSFWSSIYRGSPLTYKTLIPVQRINCEGGSSGLIGAMVAVKLARSAVLAGIPMDPERAHFDKAGAWDEALNHRQAWVNYLPQLKGKVVSMSGWTKELLK